MVTGLRNLNDSEGGVIAESIAKKFIKNVYLAFKKKHNNEDKKIFEKFDVEVVSCIWNSGFLQIFQYRQFKVLNLSFEYQDLYLNPRNATSAEGFPNALMSTALFDPFQSIGNFPQAQ